MMDLHCHFTICSINGWAQVEERAARPNLEFSMQQQPGLLLLAAGCVGRDKKEYFGAIAINHLLLLSFVLSHPPPLPIEWQVLSQFCQDPFLQPHEVCKP
jgi:hypothetical protein